MMKRIKMMDNMTNRLKELDQEIEKAVYLNGNILLSEEWILKFAKAIRGREVLEIGATSSFIADELRSLGVNIPNVYLGDILSAARLGFGDVSLYKEGDTSFRGERFKSDELIQEKKGRFIITHLSCLDRENEERSRELQDLYLLKILLKSRRASSELAVFLNDEDLEHLPRFYAVAQEIGLEYISLPVFKESKNMLLIAK